MGDLSLSLKLKNLSTLTAVPATEAILASKVVSGDFSVDETTYSETYDLSSINIKDFVGLVINGITYCHPQSSSYNSTTKIVTLTGLKLEDDDTLVVLCSLV